MTGELMSNLALDHRSATVALCRAAGKLALVLGAIGDKHDKKQIK